MSDRAFFLDYRLAQYRDSWGTFLNQSTEATSQIYLTGVGNRSYFDIRAIHYLGWAAADIQGQIPVVHPVMDYEKTLAQNIFGGEFSATRSSSCVMKPCSRISDRTMWLRRSAPS